MKVCRKCGENKPADDFYAGRAQCKPCVIARVHAHPNRDAVQRAYHHRHKERLNAARVERQRGEDGARQARYRKNHPEKHCEVQQRRIARKLGNGWEKYDRLAVYERDGGICCLCDEHVDITIRWPDPLSFSIDHIIPVSKGGADMLNNVQTAHLCCNISKGATSGVVC